MTDFVDDRIHAAVRAAGVAHDLMLRVHNARMHAERTCTLDRAVWTVVMSPKTFEQLGRELKPIDHPGFDVSASEPRFMGYRIVFDDLRSFGTAALRAEIEL